MRMLAGGIGLLSLLIAVAIIAYIWSKETKAVSDAQKSVLPQVEQLSGHGANGMKVTDSITYNPVMAGGDLRGLSVATIVPGGPMQAYYGLRIGDVITQIAGGPLNNYGNDADMATSMTFDAFEKQETLTIQRGGVQMTLPAPAPSGATASSAAASSTGAPATPPGQSKTAPPAGNHVTRQLNQILQQAQQQGN